MSGWSFGDVFFILLICGLIYGILRLTQGARPGGEAPPAPPEAPNQDPPIQELLEKYRTVAVVGASSNPERPSHHVMEYLIEAGYTVYPVNPAQPEILGRPTFGSFDELPVAPEIVDVFRASEHVPDIARQAVLAKAKVLWMQEGVSSDEGATIAREAGLAVVMDRCMLKEHRRLLGNLAVRADHPKE